MEWNSDRLIEVLKNNGVVVMPTDTLYGIVGRAQNLTVVSRIYNIKKRDLKKPCIILIGSISDLEKFSIFPSEAQKESLQKYWPGAVSIILDCTDDSYAYLHRGTKTLAFRMPAPDGLQELLKEVGPLIAPSANPEGMFPAENVDEAKKYFGESVDLYVDGGMAARKASKVIKFNEDDTETVFRE